MPSPFTTIGPIHTTFYTFIISLSLIAGMGMAMLWRLRIGEHPGAVVDASLVAIAGGMIAGRVLHVALNWIYFDAQRGEILSISAGGLDWRGAFIGAVIGLALMAKWRDLSLAGLLDALAPALPLIALAAWWGCGASHCAYGAEVDNLSEHPGWLVWEEADIYNLSAPRYATQRLGIALAALVLLVMLIVVWRGWLSGRRMWLALVLVAASMFGLGFLRGDYAAVVAGLRLGQWLDLALVMAGGVMIVLVRERKTHLINREEQIE